MLANSPALPTITLLGGDDCLHQPELHIACETASFGSIIDPNSSRKSKFFANLESFSEPPNIVRAAVLKGPPVSASRKPEGDQKAACALIFASVRSFFSRSLSASLSAFNLAKSCSASSSWSDISVGTSLDQISLEKSERDFHKAHEELYWWNDPDRTVEIVNLRISAIVEVPKTKPQERRSKGTDSIAALKEVRPVFFKGFNKFQETKIYQRSLLDEGNLIVGPAIIESFDTTVVVLPSDRAEVDGFGNIIIHVKTEVSE